MTASAFIIGRFALDHLRAFHAVHGTAYYPVFPDGLDRLADGESDAAVHEDRRLDVGARAQRDHSHLNGWRSNPRPKLRREGPNLYPYCMASLPENGYQISCLGVGRDELHCKEISEVANNIIGELANDFGFELASLDGITFAADYGKALAELDRGFATRRTLTATDVPHAQGIAMTPTVVRDGEIRFRIVAAAWVGVGLLHEDEALKSQAIYTLCHEAAHVHHESRWHRAFPEKHGTPIQEPGMISVLLSEIFSAFAEYAVCRTTATIRPESVSDYETGFVGAIDHTFSVRTEKMRAYLLIRNHQQILDEMAALFGELLKLSAYLLGHLDGLAAPMNDRAKTAYARIQQYPPLQTALEDFHSELKVLWNTEGTWPGFSAFYPLHECAVRLIATYSVTLNRNEGLFNVSVPLEVIEQFVDIQWIADHAQELAALGT